MNEVVSIPDALAAFSEQWQPHRLATVNDHDVKIARVEGEFIWHAHPNSDELFLVISGRLEIDLRDADHERTVTLAQNELFNVPAGTEHRPRSDGETVIVMLERVGTVNTGDAGGDRTREVRELDSA